MQNDPWKPQQYHLFQRERKQPYIDLKNLVRPQPSMRVVDLGCGTGELTRELHEHLHAASTLGIDASEKMLAQAASHAGPGIDFKMCDIGTFVPDGKQDLIFSNAALQWVPGHADLLPRMTSWIEEGGQIAIQLPAMEKEILHTAVAQTAAEPPFREALNGFVQHLEVHEPQWYSEKLFELGFREQHVSLRVYAHVLPTRESAIEWMKGTMLTAYQKRLAPELYEAFVKRYREVLLPRLGNKDPFLLPYQRILIWAQR